MKKEVMAFERLRKRMELELTHTKRGLEERDLEIARLRGAAQQQQQQQQQSAEEEEEGAAGLRDERLVEEAKAAQGELEEALRRAAQELEEKNRELVDLRPRLVELESELERERERESSREREEAAQDEGEAAAGSQAQEGGSGPSEAAIRERVERAVTEMQRQDEAEWKQYIEAHFAEETDAMSALRSKTDRVYEQLEAALQVAEAPGPPPSAEEGSPEATQVIRTQLDHALWAQEIESLKQVNVALHRLLEGKRRAFGEQESHLFFKMLSLKYQLTALKLQNESQCRQSK